VFVVVLQVGWLRVEIYAIGCRTKKAKRRKRADNAIVCIVVEQVQMEKRKKNVKSAVCLSVCLCGD
jgi:hypothetical protein